MDEEKDIEPPQGGGTSPLDAAGWHVSPPCGGLGRGFATDVHGLTPEAKGFCPLRGLKTGNVPGNLCFLICELRKTEVY